MPLPFIDPPTLLLATAMLGFLLSMTCLCASVSMAAFRPALATWSRSLSCAAAAFILYWLRGTIPWWASFVVANVLVMGFPVYAHLAYSRLLGLPEERTRLSGLVLLALSGVFAVAAFGADQGVAVITLSLGIAVSLGHSAWQVLRTEVARSQLVAVLGQVATICLALAFGVRAFVALLGHGADVAPVAPSSVQVGTLLLGAAFAAMASLGFLALTHHLQQRQDLESSRRDGLTGVYTRRAFMERADELLRVQPATGYAVLMADLDHFKTVNDTFGHLGGDAVLAHAARLVASTVRGTDVVGRYGGEEFVVLLPACSLQDASKLATRIVEQAQGQSVRLSDGRQARFTLSMGYAVSSHPGEPLNEVLGRADQALYAAKRGGRNRAEAAESGPLQPLAPAH